jgi:biopolymer transport protein ExbD
MPIRFRCTQCHQLLSVSRKQAGAQTACPACGAEVRVPLIENLTTSVPAPRSGSQSAAVREPQAMEAASPEFTVPPAAPALAPAPGHQDTRNVWESDLGDWEEHPAFSQAPRRSAKDEADMTSMVDVTFLLLVFFMITASFSVTKALTSQPPSAEEGAASAAPSPMTMDELAEESVVVEIGADDSIRVDDVPVAGPVELGEVLAAKIANEKKTEMVIEAEYRATHGMVVAVTDVAMQAGMQRVRRVSRPDEQ